MMDATVHNKQEEDACHFNMSISLHAAVILCFMEQRYGVMWQYVGQIPRIH